MTVDEIQNILDFAYPKIKEYYGKGKLSFPTISLHSDIYTRLSGETGMEGEESSSKAEYDETENEIYVYYLNVENEEDLLRSLIHEYTHYLQDISKFKKLYTQQYTYDTNPYELEARKAEEDWYIFSKENQ